MYRKRQYSTEMGNTDAMLLQPVLRLSKEGMSSMQMVCDLTSYIVCACGVQLMLGRLALLNALAF
jgi:hypothetical protein